MNKLSQNFYALIKEGYTLAKGITDVKDKAMVIASLAQAIATTGLVEGSGEIDTVDTATEVKETKKETKKTETKNATGKNALKPEAGKGTKTAEAKEEKVEEEIIPEVTAEVVETAPQVEAEEKVETETPAETEVEIEEEWTDAMCELKAASLERLNQYVEAWGEDYVYNTCVPAFFEDANVVGGDNIRPTNVDGFVTYLDQIADSAE
jgi:hypothetical protein